MSASSPVGYFYSADSATMTIKAKNPRFEAHTGNISYSREEGTTVSSTTTQTIPVAVKLTKAQVGPNAP
jgi:hypothetical protein